MDTQKTILPKEGEPAADKPVAAYAPLPAGSRHFSQRTADALLIVVCDEQSIGKMVTINTTGFANRVIHARAHLTMALEFACERFGGAGGDF